MYSLPMIARTAHLRRIEQLLSRHRVVGIVGPRQVGKTTLSRMLARRWKGPAVFFDLENPEELALLQDPMLALKGLRGLIVLDEIQRLPHLFSILRVLADRPGIPARFLILGSASPELLRQSSESLAGRIAYHELDGLALDEVGGQHLPRLWFRGGFPGSYLARTYDESAEWRRAFVRTFLERDLPQLGVNVRSATLHRFWMMLAHYHGQTWNSSELARSFGVADTTVRHYLDTLSSALVVRQLPSWHENISKRQVKAPKIYIDDSGILHALLNLRKPTDLETHPKIGASWEGFILKQIVHRLKAEWDECFYWATHAGAELDLLIVRGGKRFGFEIKRTSSPKITSSMKQAVSDLRLRNLQVIHAGEKTFPLAKKIRAVASSRLLQDLEPLS